MLKGKKFAAPAALLAVVAFGGGCGDDETPDGGSGNGMGDGGGGTVDRTLTIIPITDSNTDNKYVQPHTVFFSDLATHMPVMGQPESVVSVDGVVSVIGWPVDRQLETWTVGNPEAGTYDAIGTAPHDSGEEFIYLSSTGSADLVADAAKYEQKPDRAAVIIGIYYTPGGAGTERMGNVACARAYLDGNTSELDENSDQRYVEDVLPAIGPNETYQRGAVYFGNMPMGLHSVKISVDGGATLVDAELTFDVFAARQDAKGPDKNVIYTIGFDSPVPTPEGCTN